MTPADPRPAMLCQMAECAYRLGMAFGAEAERAADTDRKVEWFRLFERCFFAVRVSTALELRLRQPAKAPREAASDREGIEREDLSDREDRDRGYDERDRDREVERASFPLLLRTLDAVVADAAALPGPEPAALPTLRALLAHARSEPAAMAGSMRPASRRARLTGSGAALALASRPPPPSAAGPGFRRATGPPPR